jgi:hypothetical protein
MNTCSKGLLLSVFGLLAAQHASAGSPATVDTLTCIRNSDGSTLKHNVYAYTLGTGKTGPRYFTVYFANNLLFTYTYEEVFGSGFSRCAFGKLTEATMDTVTVVDVNAAGLGANVGALGVQGDSSSQGYTEVTFEYSFLSISGTGMPATPPGSPEEQAKALAAFKAKGLAIPK